MISLRKICRALHIEGFSSRDVLLGAYAFQFAVPYNLCDDCDLAFGRFRLKLSTLSYPTVEVDKAATTLASLIVALPVALAYALASDWTAQGLVLYTLYSTSRGRPCNDPVEEVDSIKLRLFTFISISSVSLLLKKISIYVSKKFN